MPAPVLEKTWQYDVNQDINATGTFERTRAKILYNIVRALTSFPSSPWQVVGSSNAVTAGMDGVNRWSSDADVEWGGNFSWIVLQQPALHPNAQLLLSCANGVADFLPIRWSPSSGFTGGAINARPTANDEALINVGIDGQWWRGWSTSDHNSALHVMMSSDGLITRILGFQEGFGTALWAEFARVKNPIAPLGANPYVVRWYGDASTTKTTFAGFNDVPIRYVYGLSGGRVAAYTTCPGIISAMLPEHLGSASELTGEYEAYSHGLFTLDAGKRGFLGELQDIWWGPTGVASGDNYPADGSKTFVQVHHFILPWNGTNMLMG